MPGKQFDFEQDVDEQVLADDQQRAGGRVVASALGIPMGEQCPGPVVNNKCCECGVPKWSIITVFVLVVVTFALLITLCCLIDVNTTNFWIAVAATILAGFAFLFGLHTLMLECYRRKPVAA